MKQNYINIVAKVDADTGRRLDRVRELYGFKSNYDLLQNILAAFLEHADPGTASAGEENHAVSLGLVFRDLETAKARVFGKEDELKLEKLVAMYRVSAKVKAVRLYELSGEGGFASSVNEDDAVLSALGFIAPQAVKELRNAQRLLRKATIRETICALLRVIRGTPEDEIAQMFGACADAGLPIYGERTKRKIKAVINEKDKTK